MKTKSKWLLLPIIVAMGFIPLIVHMHVFNSHLAQFDWFPSNGDTQTDFFMYYKMVAIIIVASVMLVIIIWRYFKDKKTLKWENIFYCILGFGILALLSALLSPYRFFAFRGSYEVFESIGAVLGYLVICLYTYQMISNREDLIHVLKYSGIGIFLVTVIGFFQFFGLDFFRTPIGKRIITDVSYWPQADSLSFTFPIGTSYTTLYNTNYLAFYFGLLIPVLVLLTIFLKDIKWKITTGLFAVMMVVSLAGARSKSAFLAFIGTFVIACIVLWKQLKKHWWILALTGIGFVIAMFGLSARIGGVAAIINMIKVGTSGVQYEYDITEIETNDEDVVIHINGEELHVSYNVDDSSGSFLLSMLDADGNTIPYTQDADTGAFVLENEAYKDCSIAPIMIGEEIGLQVYMDERYWHFIKQQDGGYYYYNSFGKCVKMEKIEKAHLFKDSSVSGRGELWNYMIPRLKNYILLGSGANTFAMAYPNDNYIAKKYKKLETLFDVKAHNMYLQQWMEEGLLALLCFIAFYVWYFISSVRLYRKIPKHDTVSAVGVGILLGTVTYMIVGLANDSNVGTAPVFWAVIGMGLAVNHIVRNDGKYYEENN